MSLSSELISQFAKIATPQEPKNTETTLYGTIKEKDGKMFVRFDGAELLTPVVTTVEFEDGERVTVLLKDHTATVTGNITSPASRDKTVKNIGDKVIECESKIVDNAESITLAVNELTKAIDDGDARTLSESESLIAMTAQNIGFSVSRLDERVTGNTTLINNTNVFRGTTPPTNPVAGKTLWVDYSSTPPMLKRYNSNNAWEAIATDKFKTSYIDIQDNQLNIGSTGTVNINSGAGISVKSGGNVAINSGAAISVKSGGNVAINSGAAISVKSGGNIALESGAGISVKSGGNIAINSGASIAIKSGGTFTVDASNLDIDANGTISANKAELNEATISGNFSVNGHPVLHTGNVVVSSTEPSNPAVGTIWINPNSDNEEANIAQDIYYIPERSSNYIFQNSNNNSYEIDIDGVYAEPIFGSYTYTIRLPLYSSNTTGTHYARATISSDKVDRTITFPVQTYNTPGLTWYEQSVTLDDAWMGTFATVRILVETSNSSSSFPSSTGGDMQYRRYHQGSLDISFVAASVGGGWKDATVKYFLG